MSESSDGLRIFLVENHEDTLTFLKRYLEQCGHEVSVATTMESALSTLPSPPPDVFISDIGLPDGDGWELLRKARAICTPRFSIAMSGYSGRVEHEKSREAGYDHHLVKPFLPNDLDSLLAEARRRAGKN